MANKRSPWNGYLHRHCEYVVAGVVSSFLFSIIIVSASSWSGSHLLGRVGRWMIVQDTTSEIPGFYGENGGMQGEWQGHQAPAEDTSWLLQNLQRQIKEKQREVKNMNGDLKRLRRALPNHPDVATLESTVKEFESIVTSVQQAATSLGTADADTIRDLESNLQEASSFDFYELTQSLQEEADAARRLKDAQKWLKEAGRNSKRIEKECKRMKCAGEAQEIVSEYKTLAEELKSAVNAKDADAAEDVNMELNDLNNTFWDAMQEAYVRKDIEGLNRTKKDIGRMLEEARKEAKRSKGVIDASSLQEIEDAVAEFNELADGANEALAAGDVEEARAQKDDAYAIANDLLQDLFEPLRERRGGEDGMPGADELQRVSEDIARIKKEIAASAATGKVTKAHADECTALLLQAEGHLKTHMDASAKGDEDGAMLAMLKLKKTGDKYDATCPEWTIE